MTRSVVAVALRPVQLVFSCLDPPPNFVQERLFREILDRYSPDRWPWESYLTMLYRAVVSPLSVTFTLPKVNAQSDEGGPSPSSIYRGRSPRSVHYYSPLLHQRLSTPALQSRIRSPIPHKTHPEEVLRTQRCLTQTPTTRLRPITPRPSRHPKQ